MRSVWDKSNSVNIKVGAYSALRGVYEYEFKTGK